MLSSAIEIFPLAVVKFDELPEVLVSVIILGIVGLVIFGVMYFVLHLIAPFLIRHEVETKQNPALGILIAALVVGVAIIIAATF